MSETEQRDPHIQYLRRLAEGGFDDFHVMRVETAKRVLTPKRLEVLEEIAEEPPSSIRELARRVERNVSIVSRDLDVLFEAGIISYEREDGAKRPRLEHRDVLVEPIVFDGQVLPTDD